MKINSYPLFLMKKKIKEIGELFSKEVEHARFDANDDLLGLGMVGLGGTIGSAFIGYGMAEVIRDANLTEGTTGALTTAFTLSLPATMLGIVTAYKLVPGLVAFGQVVKEKLQENKLDFSLGISDKIKDDELASKACKVLREFSDDKEKFNKFAELIDLNKDDTKKIEQLIEAGNKEVEKRDIAKGKKDYSQEFAILS